MKTDLRTCLAKPQKTACVFLVRVSGLHRIAAAFYTGFACGRGRCHGWKNAANAARLTAYLVDAGHFNPNGANINDNHPGNANPDIGASLSLKSLPQPDVPAISAFAI